MTKPSDSSCRFSLLSLGDELVQGKTMDTNSSWLAKELVELGLEPVELCTLDDGAERITEAILRLASSVDVVVITGGLGPTLDDVTREAVAAAAGAALVEDPEARAALVQRFQDMGRDMVETNLRQVLFPRGAHVLANPMGTAPGFHMTIGSTEVFALPGPPREMGPMFHQGVVPALESLGKCLGLLPRARFYLHSSSESVFAGEVHKAGDWMARDANPLVAVTADRGVLSVQLTARDRTPDSTGKLAARVREFRALFGEFIYSETESRPAFALGTELIAAGLQVTLAESCTGGGIAAALTDVPGISSVFERSFVTYSNAAKHAELGVPEDLLEAHGAVSAEVVAAMAQGAAKRAGADLALSVSGIAGPGGGSEEKPVGLVWFGLFTTQHGESKVTTTSHRFPNSDRAQVRVWAVRTGLMLLLQATRDLAKN